MPPTHAAIPSARRTSCDRPSREERDKSGRIRRKLDSFEFFATSLPPDYIRAMPHGGRRSGAPSCLAVSGHVERPLFASRPILTSGDRPNRSADPADRPWSLERPFAGPSRGQGTLCRVDRNVLCGFLQRLGIDAIELVESRADGVGAFEGGFVVLQDPRELDSLDICPACSL